MKCWRLERAARRAPVRTPGTVLHRQMRERVPAQAPELYDLFHAVVPTRLPLAEFYAHFAEFYRTSYPTQRLLSDGPRFLWRGLSRGNLGHLQRLAEAARKMGEPESYPQGHRLWDEEPSPRRVAAGLQGAMGRL